jgi:aminopeptidase N
VAGVLEGWEEMVDDIRLLYYVPKGMKDLIRNSFAKTPDMMKFFTDLTGVIYPFKTYTQVCVPEFIVGGMENTTAATLTDLTLHDDHAHLDFSSDPLIAHELAHQWFGDMVTCKDWSHIWINESFATYLENLYVRRDKGDDEFIYELLNDLQSYLDEYRKRYSRPIVMRVYKYPEELFDRHAYPKGGLALHSLTQLLGDTIFWRGINQFLKKHAFNTVDTEDLRKTLEEVSGRNLEWFFDQFVYSAGHPQLKISYRWDERDKSLRITVRQEQGDDSPETYDMPLEAIVNNEVGATTVSIPLERRETTVFLQLQSQPWHICIDPSLKLLREINVERPLEELLNALQRCRHVACRVEAAKALGKIGGVRAVRALESAVYSDPFWGVSATAALSLGEAGGSEARDALLRCLEKVRHPKVRRAIVDGLKSFREDGAVASALSRVLSDPGESYYVRGQAASSLGNLKIVSYEKVLVENLTTPSHADVITVGCLQGLAELGTDEALNAILEYTRLGKPNTVRVGATVALAKFPGRKEVYERLGELSKDPYDRVRQAVVSAARELMDHKLLTVLDEMAERDVNERVRRGAREVAKKIRDHLEKGVEYKAFKEELDRVKEENRRLVERISRMEGKGV